MVISFYCCSWQNEKLVAHIFIVNCKTFLNGSFPQQQQQPSSSASLGRPGWTQYITYLALSKKTFSYVRYPTSLSWGGFFFSSSSQMSLPFLEKTFLRAVFKPTGKLVSSLQTNDSCWFSSFSIVICHRQSEGSIKPQKNAFSSLESFFRHEKTFVVTSHRHGRHKKSCFMAYTPSLLFRRRTAASVFLKGHEELEFIAPLN